MTEASRKKVVIEPKVYRKLEKGAKNKNMTVEQYTDFLFKDFPRELSAEEKATQLNDTFG